MSCSCKMLLYAGLNIAGCDLYSGILMSQSFDEGKTWSEFVAKVADMKLIRNSERIVVGEKGARLGNFGVTAYQEDSAVVMAAEWMQPIGCERYGSDNHIYIAKLSRE